MPDQILPSNPHNVHLTPEQLERIASEDADNVDIGWIEHLDACDSCQQRLSQTAAEEGFWRRSSSLLQDADVNDDSLASSIPQQDPEPHEFRTAADEATLLVVRSLLAPSEQEEALGRLGRFEVLGIVGSGGMGIVLKARDIDIDRVVAIKIPAPHLWRSPAALETLEREARSAAAVVHPHVIAIYQVDRWRNVPYLVMPYYPAPSLDRRLQMKGPLTLEEAIRVTRQTAEALAAAHARGVIHRDVKPGNILLGRGVERAVLSDFGLAKVQSQATLTASGFLAGTPSFLSPEQAMGHRVEPASDQFSLGSVLWTMLTGEAPWAGLHPHAIVHRIASGQRPPWPETQDLPAPWVGKLLERMGRFQPEERFDSADELAAVLKRCERYMADPDTEPLPETLAPSEPARHRWRPRLLTGIAGALLVGLIALVTSYASYLAFGGTTVDAIATDRESSPQMPDGNRQRPLAGNDEQSALAPQTDQPSPAAIDATLQELEASTDQLLSEIQTLQESSQ